MTDDTLVQFVKKSAEKTTEKREAEVVAPLKFKLLCDISKEPPKKEWCIKGIIAMGETSAWIAPPGKLKSALIAEAAYAIASQADDWHGYKVKKSGAVIYFALERVSLVERRLIAYHKRSENEVYPPVAVVPGLVDLTNPAIIAVIVSTIAEVEAATGVKVVMLVIDTFAKTIAAGGGDEDKARDQGKVFANLQRLKDALKADAPHIALIGHTGKNEDRGSRGSNAIVGDVDLMVTISGDKVKTATSIKANDGEERPLFSFKSVLVEDGVDDDGEPTTINIVSAQPISGENAQARAEPRLTDNQEAMLRLLWDAGPAGLSGDDWNARAREAGIGVTRRSTLVNLKGQLKDKGLVHEYLGIWRAQKR
jgi:hypothetical protein